MGSAQAAVELLPGLLKHSSDYAKPGTNATSQTRRDWILDLRLEVDTEVNLVMLHGSQATHGSMCYISRDSFVFPHDSFRSCVISLGAIRSSRYTWHSPPRDPSGALHAVLTPVGSYDRIAAYLPCVDVEA